MTTFYIVRHGQSEANVAHIVQGARIDTSLTEKGRKQAEELADVFKDIPLTAVYSSPSKRASETADVIAKRYTIPHETAPLLRERSFGKYEGMNDSEFLAKYTGFNELTTDEKMDYQLDDEEESNRSGVDRLITFLESTAAKHPKETIAVVSHGGVIRPFIIATSDEDFDTVGGLDNCGYIKVEADGSSYHIVETKGIKSWKEKKGHV